MSMWRSPHKKKRPGVIPSTMEKIAIVGGKTTYPAIWPFKKSVSKNHGGRAGDKGSKRFPIQAPGMPSGKCLGTDVKTGRARAECRCGTHNKKGRTK